MLKRYSLHLAGLAAAAVIAVHAGPALALTAAHVATATGATQGDCSICHVAHKAQGSQRLFPNAPSAAGIGSYGFMGAMCAEYCHNQSVNLPRAYAGDTALLNVGSSTAASASHGLNLSGVAMPPTTSVPSTLPYGDGTRGTDSRGTTGNFECTTCHDPHKNATAPSADTSNALLRLDIDALCDECHTGRGAGDGAWGNAYGDTNVLGSHPVGTDVQNDSETNSNIFIGGVGASANNTSFDRIYGAAGAHVLGGHLIDGGAITGTTGITCVTCHAVHGNQTDPGNNASAPPAPTGPFEDLLVISQGVQGATEPTRSANGSGNASNALCNGCHLESSGNSWNPGATAFGHPADNHVSTLNMGVIADPGLGWPYGTNAVATTLDLGIICETCHDPHGATTNSHILRLDETAICGRCHTSAPSNHHPSSVAMGAMADTNIDQGVVGTLECSDCHQGNGAHNWAAAGAVGLNSNWEPRDNARGAATDAVGLFTVNMSKECIDCHTTGGTLDSPTLHNGNASTNGGTNTLTDRGSGTHYIGPANGNSGSGNGDLSLGTLSSTAVLASDNGTFNPFTTAWVAGRGWSRWGGTAIGTYQIVCESCHELEMDKNVAGTALLLYEYHDKEDQPTSRLCTGCHGIIPGAASVHPLTGATISAAQDEKPTPRSPVTLITASTGYADAGSAPNLAEYPATANRMNCDSCHQPHDTVTNAGTFILEYTDNAAGTAPLDAVTVDGVAIATFRATTSQRIPHNTLCTQCHNY